jgi:hypothetical protein
MVLKLEILQKEYDVTLAEYQESVNNYIALLEQGESQAQGESQTQDKEYIALKGRTWWGTTALDEKKVDSQEECENMCRESEECSGATYHEQSHYCWTRKGVSPITSGRDDDYALVPAIVAALERMKYLNQQLMKMNEAIVEEMSSSTNGTDAVQKRKQLEANYDELLEQQAKMNAQLEEYNSVEEEKEKQMLYADQQNASYKGWAIVAGLLLLMALKGFYGAESSASFFTYGATLLVLSVVLSFALRTPSGFFAIFMLVVAIAGMKASSD